MASRREGGAESFREGTERGGQGEGDKEREKEREREGEGDRDGRDNMEPEGEDVDPEAHGPRSHK